MVHVQLVTTSILFNLFYHVGPLTIAKLVSNNVSLSTVITLLWLVG